jgi:N-acetylglucosaminyldiphosphoundecaprenol N-acetyl-beta-D-mannosaminyltransferase
MRIFGVRIDNLSREEILAAVDGFLDGPELRRIATVNPEFLLLAREDQAFADILNAYDLNVADGFGLHLAFWRRGKRLKCRFPGADLMPHILSLAEQKGLRVFLAARKDGLSSWQETAEAVRKRHPRLEISGEDREVRPSDFSKTHAKAAGYDVVFCNFGAPAQEVFLAGLAKASGTVRLAMGVGGTFDYLTGKAKRAPRWVRAMGFEWLWRLTQQPKRWRRIWSAVIVFPALFLREHRRTVRPSGRDE